MKVLPGGKPELFTNIYGYNVFSQYGVCEKCGCHIAHKDGTLGWWAMDTRHNGYRCGGHDGGPHKPLIKTDYLKAYFK